MTDSVFISREFVDTIIDTKPPENKLEIFLDWLQFVLFKDEMRQIEFKQSKLQVYLNESSEQSLTFLKHVESYNNEIFDRTDIKYFIEYKWRNNYKMYLPLFIYSYYIYTMIGTAINPDEEYHKI